MLSISAAHAQVGIGTTTPRASLEVNGYTKLGADAPAIKVKKLTATTPNAQGQVTAVAHGLNLAKIISITGLVETPFASWVTLNFTTQSGFQVGVYADATNVNINTAPSNSSSVLNRPVRLLITYEE
ncbi:hypothetical protein F0P96_04100 [Hymenobacter busanensis]|uniref:Uncharacterized protein n=1 Tax=Hymenobacter busanensis TaxID=2607656 RepID=A0A7L4ZSW9_9BACT|nr:hypothetical protein [Hymenobacter busanensis]KAA9339807.1 hypothetical protein F0P96_04100 [Hymenobacter busanensis]QHJ06439.1 hypothetical protein GUY19_03645 [Hymenobacter busanensis]